MSFVLQKFSSGSSVVELETNYFDLGTSNKPESIPERQTTHGQSVLQLDCQKYAPSICQALAKHTEWNTKGMWRLLILTVSLYTSTNPHRHGGSYPLSQANLNTHRGDPCGKTGATHWEDTLTWKMLQVRINTQNSENKSSSKSLPS